MPGCGGRRRQQRRRRRQRRLHQRWRRQPRRGLRQPQHPSGSPEFRARAVRGPRNERDLARRFERREKGEVAQALPLLSALPSRFCAHRPSGRKGRGCCADRRPRRPHDLAEELLSLGQELGRRGPPGGRASGGGGATSAGRRLSGRGGTALLRERLVEAAEGGTGVCRAFPHLGKRRQGQWVQKRTTRMADGRALWEDTSENTNKTTQIIQWPRALSSHLLQNVALADLVSDGLKEEAAGSPGRAEVEKSGGGIMAEPCRIEKNGSRALAGASGPPFPRPPTRLRHTAPGDGPLRNRGAARGRCRLRRGSRVGGGVGHRRNRRWACRVVEERGVALARVGMLREHIRAALQ